MNADLWIFIGKCVLIGAALLAVVWFVASKSAAGDAGDPHN